MSNKGTFSTNKNIAIEEKVSEMYMQKFPGEFFPVKGNTEYWKDGEYEKAGLPVYPESWYDPRKNAVDLVRKNLMVDFKFADATYIALSEMVIASSQKAASRKLNQECDYVIEVVNKKLTKSLRINVSEMMRVNPAYVSGKHTKKVKLHIKSLIKNFFYSPTFKGSIAHMLLIAQLKAKGFGTYGNLHRPWDL
jgi:hypothetical protein